MAIYDDINIIYEDNHVLVVVKPQNVPVQADESGDPDLLTMLKQYRADNEQKPGGVYLGLVHRLDRPTGGVMVFAKTSKAATRLCEAIVTGDFEKKYLAVVNGKTPKTSDTLVHYLLKTEKTNTVSIVPLATVGAKKAITKYRLLDNAVIAKDGEQYDLSLLSLEIPTGRGHQIRVQLSGISCPIVGDRKYGEKAPAFKCNMALWAYELRFSHPVTHEKLVFRVSPAPTDFPWSKFDLAKVINVY